MNVDYAKVEAKVETNSFVFTYPKTIQDINGKDVVVVDRVEELTLEQLQQNLQGLQDQLKATQAKIDAVSKL